MASAVADLEAGLQAMLNLKPPGVTGSRIMSLTSLCVANVQSESVLIQKIYTQFKKAPRTHKLGVLYVVDSVTRKWLEQAKAQGQTVNASAQDGTFAAGVHRVTELMPVLINDIFQSAPDEQKEKLKKLLDIWEKGQTFPPAMIQSFKEKLQAPPPKTSTTPGSPSQVNSTTNAASQPSNPAPPNGSSILEALANMARQNTSAAPSTSSMPTAAPSYGLPAPGMPQSVSPVQQQQPQHPPPPPQQQIQHQQQAAQAPTPAAYSAPQPAGVGALPFPLSQVLGHGIAASPPVPNTAPQAPNPYSSAPPPAPGASALDPNTQQQIVLIKALVDQGVPLDKIPALIQSLSGSFNNGAQPAYQAPIPASQGSFPAGGQQSWPDPRSASELPRDQGYRDGLRSPGRHRGRSHSRSPDRAWGGRGSPNNRRDRSDYGHDRGGRRSGDYRQRSPQGRKGRSPSPSADLPKVERHIEYDRSLPPGHIRVYSRTLFVGGVTCSESELRNIFSRFGIVQTCIVNKDKRHAFVKMLTRKDAQHAKESTEDNRMLELPLRTRWGVGFGPRDCSDYATGISVIPIQKLTEADRKWMLTAPYGGSGGRPIEDGLSVEEPDIEIGAGVSSKAISRRMQTDKGGSNGPKSTRHRDDDSGRGKRRRGGGRGGDAGAAAAAAAAGAGQQPALQGFNVGMGGLPNGMSAFPATFAYPGSGGAPNGS